MLQTAYEYKGAQSSVTKYKNIIFDFGNVIASFSHDALIAGFCADPKDYDVMKAAIFDRWGDLDIGRISYKDYMEQALAALPAGLHGQAIRFFHEWHKQLPYIDGITDLICRLKAKGYHIFLLSNAPSFLDENLHDYPVFSCFEGAVVSGSVKMEKPDRKIFEYALKKFNIDPRETLFIDDSKDNIDGAALCGIAGYLFDGDAGKLARSLEDAEQ